MFYNIPIVADFNLVIPITIQEFQFHAVYKYRGSKTLSGSPEERMDKAMHYTGSALFSTTIALVGGFLIIASSATPSVTDFGILCAVTVAIALITDVFYLPALLKKFDK